MRSFLSLTMLFFGLLLSLSLPNGAVDARINSNSNSNRSTKIEGSPQNAKPVIVKPAIKIGSSSKQQTQSMESATATSTRPQRRRSLLTESVAMGVRHLLSSEHGHRSLGGGVVSDTDSERSLAQQQDWARDDSGNILWWIWLIIGLSCAMCCIVCCCASACCLRD